MLYAHPVLRGALRLPLDGAVAVLPVAMDERDLFDGGMTGRGPFHGSSLKRGRVELFPADSLAVLDRRSDPDSILEPIMCRLCKNGRRIGYPLSGGGARAAAHG